LIYLLYKKWSTKGPFAEKNGPRHTEGQSGPQTKKLPYPQEQDGVAIGAAGLKDGDGYPKPDGFLLY
jgi:hypothetical protein